MIAFVRIWVLSEVLTRRSNGILIVRALLVWIISVASFTSTCVASQARTSHGEVFVRSQLEQGYVDHRPLFPFSMTCREMVLDKNFQQTLAVINACVAKASMERAVQAPCAFDSLTDSMPALPSSPICFISYVCQDPDMGWSRLIEAYLRQAGVQTIFDRRDLRTGDAIERFIKESVHQATFAILLFSPQYVTNYDRQTYIYDEAEAIRIKWEQNVDFVIPVLLAGEADTSIPPVCLGVDSKGRLKILYVPMTNATHDTAYEACLEGIHRILSERIFYSIIGVGAPYEHAFHTVRQRFTDHCQRLPRSAMQTELKAARRSFPQSLKPHKAFIDRRNVDGQRYVDILFDALFMDEDSMTSMMGKRPFSEITVCAVSGMGGVGKTTLATEYVHTYKSFYQFIYWMDGSSRRDFQLSCLALIETLGLRAPEQGEGEGDEAYGEVLITWINDHLPKCKPNWLLVVDNVDEPALTTSLKPEGGHILYTSRSKEWLKKPIALDVFQESESIAYLLQMTGFDDTHYAAAKALAIELDHLPLALAQAAAYIRLQQTETRFYTFMDYLREYQERYAYLLEQQQIQPSINRREAIVMTTWDTTMHKLSEEARHLMGCFAYMNSSGISQSLFKDIEKYEKAINELLVYSMIKQNEEEQEISIHNLVQKVSQLKQEKEGFMASRYIEEALASLYGYWQQVEKANSLGEQTMTTQRAYEQYLQVDAHVTRIYHHMQRFQKEKILSKKRKRVFQSNDRFINIKIANHGLKLLLTQAVRDQREIAFQHLFVTASQLTDLISMLKDAFDDEEMELNEGDYQEIATMLPQLSNINNDDEAHLIDCARVLASVKATDNRSAYVKMINALSVSGLPSLSFVSVMQICVAIAPEDRESFVHCVQSLLSLLGLPLLGQQVNNELYCGEYEGVISCVANEEPQNRQNLVDAIQPFIILVPSDEFASFMFSFSATLDSIDYVPASHVMQALLRDDLEKDDCCLILHTAIEHYKDIAKKKNCVEQIRGAFNHLPSEDYAYAVMAALMVKPTQFNTFMTQLAPSYINLDTHGDSKSWLLPRLCLLKKKAHASFITCVDSLLTVDMVKNGRYKIAEIMASVDQNQWHNLVDLAKRIYAHCPEINGENREWVLSILARFDTTKEDAYSFVDVAAPILSLDETGKYYAPILESLMTVKGNRAHFVQMLLPLLPTGENGHKCSEILQSFVLCDSDQLNELTSIFRPLLDLWIQDERISRNSYNFINLLDLFDHVLLKEQKIIVQKVVFVLKAAHMADQDIPAANKWLREVSLLWFDRNLFQSKSGNKSMHTLVKMIMDAMED